MIWGRSRKLTCYLSPALGPNRSCQLHSGPGGVGAAGTERFTYTQKVPSEAAFHDAANEHFLLLLLLALLGSSSGGVEGSGAFLLPGLALRPFSVTQEGSGIYQRRGEDCLIPSPFPSSLCSSDPTMKIFQLVTSVLSWAEGLAKAPLPSSWCGARL